MDELDDVGPGSLKLVVAGGGVERVLREHVPDKHIRPAGRGAWIIFTEAEVTEVRNWLVVALGDGAQVFVAEFEHWSGQGDIDAAWLLRRGH
jgi:hypothetical protein